jgi:general secretion pathway protein G
VNVNPSIVRWDKNLKPINADYDLYSCGPDGVSKQKLTHKDSLDDIVRANGGAYIGIAQDY